MSIILKEEDSDVRWRERMLCLLRKHRFALHLYLSFCYNVIPKFYCRRVKAIPSLSPTHSRSLSAEMGKGGESGAEHRP